MDNRARERTVHGSREQEMHSTEGVHEMYGGEWKPPSNLEAPPARPGYAQKWVRVGSMGKDDATNVARKFREGWKPRTADSVPKSFPVPRITQGTWAGCIMVEGMLLCELPKELRDKRAAYFKRQTDRMTEAIDQELAQAGTAKTPIQKAERSTLVREVPAAED